MNPKAHSTMIMLPIMIHVGELGGGTVCWFMGSANEYPRSVALILSNLLCETSALRLMGDNTYPRPIWRLLESAPGPLLSPKTP